MSKRITPLIYAAAAITIAVSAAVIIYASAAGTRIDTPLETTVESISIEGEYSIDGSPPVRFGSAARLRAAGARPVVLRGHFTSGVPAGERVMFHLSDMSAEVLINGVSVFSFDGGAGRVMRTSGDVWTGFDSDGITVSDEVELRLRGLYELDAGWRYTEFFSSLCVGSAEGLTMSVLRTHSLELVAAIAETTLGVVMLTAALIMAAMGSRAVTRALSLAGLALFGGLSIYIDTDVTPLLLPYPEAASAADVLLQFLAVSCMALFCVTHLAGRWKAALRAVAASVMLFTVLVSVLQLLGVCDLRQIRFQCDVVTGLCMLGELVCMAGGSVRGGRRPRMLLVMFLPLLAGGTLELLNYYLIHLKSVPFFVIGLFSTTAMLCSEQVVSVQMLVRTVRGMNELERQLNEERIAIMLSQIQPHFLYNALSAIRCLCDDDPKAAGRMIEDFSNYLRANMNSLKQREPIPFEMELAHIKNYTDIECVRFGERVKIKYDLETTDFRLPALTVQPLVENAIRYGITKRREGGTVWISTRRERDFVELEVRDDGVGFDTLAVKDDGRTHIGIDNVRDRLSAMCGGTLEIKSAAGEGTAAVVRIPLARQA